VALCAGTAWTTAAVAAGHLGGARVPDVPQGGEVGAALEMTAIGAGCGLLVGAVAGVFLVRRHGTGGREVLAVATVAGVIIGGIGGGLSVLMTTMFGGLPAEVSSGLAWAVAGLFAGFAGGIGERFAWKRAGCWRWGGVRRAARWAVVAALVGALASAAAAAGELWSGTTLWYVNWHEQLWESVTYGANGGALGGLLVGAAIGFVSGWPIRLGLVGGLIGLLGGGLLPLFIMELGPSVPGAVGFGLAGAIAGFAGGLVGHLLAPRPAETVEEPNEEDEPTGGACAATARRTPAGRPMLRLLPVLAVAVLTIVAAIATFPPGTRVVLIAVGLLGLAVAHVQAGQERRIRELEHRLRLAQPGSPPSDGIPITADARPSAG
jgi:hypothetical protein